MALDAYPALLAGWAAPALACLALAALLRGALRRVQYVGEGEQLLLKTVAGKEVRDGPAVVFPSLWTTLSYSKRKGTPLSAGQYAVVQDAISGAKRVVRGPRMLLLGAYEKQIGGVGAATVLDARSSVVVLDAETGARRLVVGPTTFVPGAHEKVQRRDTAVCLHANQFIKVEDTLTGAVRMVRGEQMLWLQPHETQSGVREAFSLGADQQVRLRDAVSGDIRCARGPQMIFPRATEELVGGKIETAIHLSTWEFCHIQNKETGKIRVERGEQIVFLGPNDTVVQKKTRAFVVDKTHAVLLRDRETGVQTLITEPQLFVPTAQQEVMEIRERICLTSNQAVILKDPEGNHHIRFGSDDGDGGDDDESGDANPSSFFLPPHWETVTLMWSRGRRREKRDLAITIFDTRPQYMSFEFNCRTSDNVEMVLEGTFFWEVVDIAAMLRFTGDAPGDVCSHARSCFIQLISKVTLQQFMEQFNHIAQRAAQSDDTFYTQRGIKIHSLEVTRYACADRSTAAILEQIIAETTNRMNRLSCQESENEVKLAQLHGEEEQENAKSAVLKIKQLHQVEMARAEGSAEAEKVLAFLKRIEGSDGSDVDDGIGVAGGMSAALAQELWHALRRAEAIRDVSQGTATVYFPPKDANLVLEHRK